MTKKLIMTGSTGFIGSVLLSSLQQKGYRVLCLTQGNSSESNDVYHWNPEGCEIPAHLFEGVEGVIHLAGENIGSFRWSKAKKARIIGSRVNSTLLLARTLLHTSCKPSFFFSASAVGYYGSQGASLLSEKSPQGSGFLADVCGQWEAASHMLKKSSIRVVHGRFGTVLDPRGGFLKKLIPLLKLKILVEWGRGDEWISWISREELVTMLEWILFSSSIEGAVNCVSLYPVTVKNWAEVFSKAYHTWMTIHIPPKLIRCTMGDAGQSLLLSSIKAIPEKLTHEGYPFQSRTLQDFVDQYIASTSF